MTMYMLGKKTFSLLLQLCLPGWLMLIAISGQAEEALAAPQTPQLQQTVQNQSPESAIEETVQEPSASPLTPVEQLDDAHERFASYYDDGLYSQATVAAGQTLQLAQQIYGTDSLETALALGNLATVQRKSGELKQAMSNYETSIYLIEEREGIIAYRLVNPLMGLAATQNALGAFELGLTTYNRALRINHVELGLNNVEQMRIRDGLTESYIGMGDVEDANFQQENQLRIIRDQYPNDLTKLTAATYKLADWYRRSYQPEKETLLMQNAVRNFKKAAGSSSADQVNALMGLASAYQQLDMPAQSLQTLKKALRINNKSATSDPLLGAEVQVQLADLYNAYGESRNARRTYAAAWQTLADADAAEDIVYGYFGEPTRIYSVQLPDVYPTNSKTLELFTDDPDLFRNGLLVADFDVDENGRIDNIRIIESDPAGLMDKKISYLLGRQFYRPRMLDGETVTTEGLQIRHGFSYLPKQETKKQDDKPARDSNSGKLEYPGAGT